MIKKYALAFLVIFLICELAQAQSFYRRNRKTGYQVFFGVGTASYHGDLVAPRINLDLGGAISAGVQFPIEGRFGLRGELLWSKISADEDKTEDKNDNPFVRNLSFKSSNIDLGLMGVFRITPNSPRARTDLTTYALAGLGGTYFNPKAELNGTDYELRPLQTEGEDYSSVALSIPLGLGANVRLSYEWSIALEAIYRFTTTDYLDDVSDVYVDNGSFSDPIARQLADRRPEVGLPVLPAGSRRGNSSNNDGYLAIQAKVNYHFNQGMYYKRKKRRPSKVFRRR